MRIVQRCVQEDREMLLDWFKTVYTSAYEQEHKKEEDGENGENGECAHAVKPRDCFC